MCRDNQLMANSNTPGATNDATVNRQALETVSKFRHPRAIVTDEGCRPEIL